MDSLRPNIDESRIEPGTLIANYVVEELLGQGTEGCVYVARDSLLGRQVALKTLRVVEVGETRGVEEARMLAGLEHPNVVRVFHARRHHGTWYVVFEYLSGGNLHALLERLGPLPAEQALDLLSQAAAGLAYVHEQSILHRDVKPHNMLLSRRGDLKLCDFGLALDLRGPRRAQNLLVGTPAFLAPELWAGSAASTASDVFSLGVCLFQLLSGRLPFAGNTTEQLRQAQAELTPIFPAGLPPAVVELAQAMLARDPAARPSSRELPALLQSLALEPYPGARGRGSSKPNAEASPFAAAGPEWATRQTLLQGCEAAHVLELLETLNATAGVELCSANPCDGLLLLDAAREQNPSKWPLLARFTLHKPHVSLCHVIERQLGLPPKHSLAQACEHLADPARRNGMGAIVAVHAPRGLSAEQCAELEYTLATLAPHQVRCVLIAPLPRQDAPRPELAGFHRIFALAAPQEPREVERRLALWLQLATDGRFHFSCDGLRLAAHYCQREGCFWATLAQQSLLLACAAGTRIVASWAVVRALGQPLQWHAPSEVPVTLRKRPLSWPSKSVAHQLRQLQQIGPQREHDGHGSSWPPSAQRCSSDTLAV